MFSGPAPARSFSAIFFLSYMYICKSVSSFSRFYSCTCTVYCNVLGARYMYMYTVAVSPKLLPAFQYMYVAHVCNIEKLLETRI